MDALGWRGNHIESFGESKGDQRRQCKVATGVELTVKIAREGKEGDRRRQYEQKSLASTAKQIINAGCGC